MELSICCYRCPFNRKLFKVLSELLDVVDDPLPHPKNGFAWVFTVIKAFLDTTLQSFQLIYACLSSGFVCALHPADGYAFTLQQLVAELLRCGIDSARAIIYPFELVSSSYP